MTSRLSFNESNHTYWLADKVHYRKSRAPSVSALKNTLYPFTGERWYLREAGQALTDDWDILAATPLPLRGETLQTLAGARIAYGRDFGRAVHHYCEHLWGGEALEVPEEFATYVTAVAEWWDAERVELVAAEAMCFADRDDVMGSMAGRLDLLVNHPKRGIGLVDLKTWTSRSAGQPRVKEWAFQLAAYSTMDYLVTPGGDQVFPHVNWHAVLHVGPGGLRQYLLARDEWAHAVEQVDATRILKSIRPGKMQEVA